MTGVTHRPGITVNIEFSPLVPKVVRLEVDDPEIGRWRCAAKGYSGCFFQFVRTVDTNFQVKS